MGKERGGRERDTDSGDIVCTSYKFNDTIVNHGFSEKLEGFIYQAFDVQGSSQVNIEGWYMCGRGLGGVL